MIDCDVTIDDLELTLSQGYIESDYPSFRRRFSPAFFRNCSNAVQSIFDAAADQVIRRHDLRQRVGMAIRRICDLTKDKYPAEFMRGQVLLGELLILTGAGEQGLTIVQQFAERPYLLQDVDLVSRVMHLAARGNMAAGRLDAALAFATWSLEYRIGSRFSSWRHVWSSYRDILAAVSGTSSSAHPAWLRPASAFMLIAQHIEMWRPRRASSRLSELWLRASAALVYAYLRTCSLFRKPWPNSMLPAPLPDVHARVPHAQRPILVTRAMGGIGDLLMMTAGLHHLAAKAGQPVHFATKNMFFPLFKGNPDVVPVDIDGDPIDLSRYSRWINLTDCPAARIESRTRPRVKLSRIEIFAQAMKVKTSKLGRHELMPRYVLDESDRVIQQRFWEKHCPKDCPVIGVQLFSADSYKDYPDMENLVQSLAQRCSVLVFDNKPIEGFVHANVAKVESRPLREAFALAAACDVLVTSDTAFVHLGGALNLPTICLYGPTDGDLFTRFYPKAVVVDSRKNLGCLPCWRNEDIPCRLTMQRESVCLRMLTVDRIVRHVETALSRRAAVAG